MLSKLPEELLEMMIQDLAYAPAYPSNSLSSARCKRVSSELIALSVVNWQLRRISLPFLFAFVTLKHLEDVEGFLQTCLVNPTLGSTIRVIKLNVDFPSKDGHEELCRLLPHLTRLACVDLQDFTSSISLLNTVNQHPSISAMIVDSLDNFLDNLPPPLSSLNLSKVVVECGYTSQPGLETSYARGLKVYQLIVPQPELLKEEFGNSRFQGLHEISLAMNRHPILLEWLPRLASTHPHLKNVIFVDMSNSKMQYTSDTIPFILPFIEKSLQQGLDTTYNITRLVISRTQCGSLSATMEWRVTELIMNLHVSHTYIRWVLGFFVKYGTISSLRVLKPARLFKNLRSPDEKIHLPWKPFRHIDKIHRVRRLGARAEVRLYWYMSLVSKGLPSLEAVYVEEVGYGNEKFRSQGYWSLQGWLSVRGATGDVTGSLELRGTPSGSLAVNLQISIVTLNTLDSTFNMFSFILHGFRNFLSSFNSISLFLGSSSSDVSITKSTASGSSGGGWVDYVVNLRQGSLQASAKVLMHREYYHCYQIHHHHDSFLFDPPSHPEYHYSPLYYMLHHLTDNGGVLLLWVVQFPASAPGGSELLYLRLF
ncbi:hypothetical protein F5877DRAFT_63274 [Lentinula edodes]|nr:hypothetical protein F5877DRAFT_63274 [Lentinula edodes]